MSEADIDTTADSDTFNTDTSPESEAAAIDEETRKRILEVFPDADIPVDAKMIEDLSEGLLLRFVPTLRKTKQDLSELTENQRIQIETILQENAKFRDCQQLAEVKETMEKGKQYQDKLIRIKKEMLQLHEKSAKLKKRAITLQQHRQKQELQEEQQREQQAARERQLIAKPAAKPAKQQQTT